MENDNTSKDVLKIQEELLKLSKQRSALSEERSQLAQKRTEMSTERTEMSTKRTQLANERTALASERTQLAHVRTEMSAKRSYMNAERTLSVWIRTSLSAMVFGIAIDRFGLMIKGMATQPNALFDQPYASTSLVGALLVLLSVVMSLTAGIRYIIYTQRYRKDYDFPYNYRIWLPTIYAFMVVFFGTGLFIFMLLTGGI